MTRYYPPELLERIDNIQNKTIFTRITILSFKDEVPIQEVQGQCSSGSISVSSSSSLRRSLSLSMNVDENTADITNLDNLIAINKKIRVEQGIKNTLSMSETDRQLYGDIFWFPQGVFIISSVSMTFKANAWQLSITAKDKMSMLNGTAGGVFPSTIELDKESYIDTQGVQRERTHLLFDIIFNAVRRFGGELPGNIFINDLDNKAQELVKNGSYDDLYLVREKKSQQYIYLTNSQPSFSPTSSLTYKTIAPQQDIGYRPCDFVYPGSLTAKAGETVTSVLDKIVKTLGNYEYFYDVYGHFIFQEIKNYKNTVSPLQELNESDYVRSYSNTKYAYSLTDANTISQYQVAPAMDKMKNEFIVWGTKDNSNCWYHLVIDKKPEIKYANTNLWYNKDATDFLYKAQGETPGGNWQQVGKSCNEWREELYRRYLLTIGPAGTAYYSPYDEELDANLRNVFDTMNEDWEGGWNPDVKKNPTIIKHWLDFIDTPQGDTMKYSVENIGRRTIAKNESKIAVLRYSDVPNIVFVRTWEEAKAAEKAGSNFMYLNNDNYQNMLQISTTSQTAFDKIRDLVYENFAYNIKLTITTTPRYYYEPNQLLHVENEKLQLNDNYQITQFSVPLAYNGTMSITASQVKLY